MSLLDHLRGYARQRPQALALQDAQGALTRGGLWSAVQRLAGQLLATGITRYSSQLDNGIDAVVLDLALRTIGAVHLPLPGFFTPRSACMRSAMPGSKRTSRSGAAPSR